MIPITAPAANVAITGMFRVVNELSMNSYLPISSNMKLPDIPGSIIAQIAMAPEMKINHKSLGVCAGESRQIAAPIAVPISIGRMFEILLSLISFNKMNADAIISPKKNDHNGMG